MGTSKGDRRPKFKFLENRMNDDTDVLQSVPDDDILKLRELYADHLPRLAHIYNYLESVAKWKAQGPGKNYITLMAPHGNWSTGTFVAVHEYTCYEIFLFTLDNDYEPLRQVLESTKKIRWNDKLLLMYAIYADHYATVLKAMDKTTFRLSSASTCDIMWIPKEKALEFDLKCPPEVYIADLDKSHATIINPYWPPKYQDSDKYLATMIEMNGGCGIFLKSTGELVAWVIRNLLGLGALQAVNDHKRKGYGSLVTKALSKSIAEKGADPLGTVNENNVASQIMFKNLGFESLGKVTYVESKEIRNL